MGDEIHCGVPYGADFSAFWKRQQQIFRAYFADFMRHGPQNRFSGAPPSRPILAVYVRYCMKASEN